MGCFVVKEERIKDSSIIENEGNTEEESFLGTLPSLGRFSREISRVDDFKLTHMDFIGQKYGEIQDEYTLLEPPIGRGAFGEVRRAVHLKSNQTRAVKMIYKESMSFEEQQRMENEVNILKSLDHPNIMKVFGFYQNEHCFYIITEFFSGGELFEEITNMKNFSERRAAITMRQIVSAINFCHQHKIVHRDLKPENILYESKNKESLIKVVDFGTSRFFDSSMFMKRKFGTPYYIAPEVLKHSYTEKCDIWSCGVILYIMLCGVPPFNGQTYKEIMKKVKLGKYSFDGPEWAEVSETAQELIKNMMKYNPEERYTAAQVLNDPWFKLVLGEETFDKPLMISALDNLSKFRAELKLQEAVWLFLISYTATREERDHLLRLFQVLDLDGDGKLSREELIIGYTKIMKSENAEEEVEAILKSVDSNRSGSIEYTEFIMATLNKHKMLSKDRLDVVFKLIDKDGDGHIDIQELKEALNPGHQAEIGDEVWRTLIEEVDKDGDGKISYNEFVEMMIKFLEG